MAGPVLLFCIGATKAGTSWLHRYISNHPQCHMRGIKELHYFDSVEFNDYGTWIADVEGRRDSNLAQLLTVEDAEIRAAKERVAEDAEAWAKVLRQRRPDDAGYLAYLKGGLDGQRLVGDFTPAYALLPLKRLQEMAVLQDEVRFVYLLRDPVDRVWSHCRMMAKRRANKPSEIQRRSVNIMRRIYKGKEPEIVRRSDYIGPLERLREAVRPDQLRVIFYEDLFSEAAIAGLCAFLGIDPAPAEFGRKVLRGPDAEMEPGQYEEMRDFLAPQYAYITSRFEQVPERWTLSLEAAR
ncbi:MAG: sulfotransferase [Rhodobacter sp.]|nr:sulfotransferase [Rhodobacter sp.]